MKTLSIIVLSLLVTVSCALASGGTEVEGLGLMTSFFIAFGVLIVLYQFIPEFDSFPPAGNLFARGVSSCRH